MSEWKLVPNECTNPDGSSYASTFAKGKTAETRDTSDVPGGHPGSVLS